MRFSGHNHGATGQSLPGRRLLSHHPLSHRLSLQAAKGTGMLKVSGVVNPEWFFFGPGSSLTFFGVPDPGESFGSDPNCSTFKHVRKILRKCLSINQEEVSTTCYHLKRTFRFIKFLCTIKAKKVNFDYTCICTVRYLFFSSRLPRDLRFSVVPTGKKAWQPVFTFSQQCSGSRS